MPKDPPLKTPPMHKSPKDDEAPPTHIVQHSEAIIKEDQYDTTIPPQDNVDTLTLNNDISNQFNQFKHLQLQPIQSEGYSNPHQWQISTNLDEELESIKKLAPPITIETNKKTVSGEIEVTMKSVSDNSGCCTIL